MTRWALILLGTLLLHQGNQGLGGASHEAVDEDEEGTCESSLSPSEEEPPPQPPLDGSDLGEPQRSGNKISGKELTKHIEAARRYMNSDALKEKGIDPEILELCRNKHELCTIWR
jgi:hypothetical protein